ncbi:MAG: periplasmic heavy metal sensor [Bacteroidetes bacterium]|nr:periplasmic heavy metal sensor [Bacteroidota bacterium]
MKPYRFVVLFLLFAAVAVPELTAQMDGPPPDGRGRQRLEELRRLKMIEALKLDEEQAVRLTVREREFREKEKERMDQRAELLEEISELIKDEADDAALKNALDRMNTLSVSIVEERYTYVLSLKDFLSMEQIARLVVFEHRFAEEVKRILSNVRKRPHR